MNTLLLNSVMSLNGAKAKDMAEAIRKSHVSFNKKRCGDVPFNVKEIMSIASALSLTLEQVNDIFFDSCLPSSKNLRFKRKLSISDRKAIDHRTGL